MIVLAPFQKQIPLYLSILCKNFITNSPKIKHLIPRAWFLSGQFSHHLKYHTIQTSLPKPLLSNLLLSLKIHSQSRLSQNVANNESKLLKMYLSSLLQEYNILEKELNRNKNHQMKASEMTSQYIELMPVAVKIRELNAKEKELQEIEEFLFELGSEDKELEVVAEKEKADCICNIQTLESEIKLLLSVNNGDDVREVIIEILPGVGGQESQVFAQEMFLMYQNYAYYKGWSCTILTEDRTEIGGVRKASVIIAGENVYECLKFEGGVHRVQRIPKTEKSGRVHTSTVTVVILPQPKEIDVILKAKDLQITTCRASGSGGQHVNTTNSAVRIVHLPTGISAESQQERSQLKNKELAMKLLKSRIYEKQLKTQEEVVQSKRKQQVGSAGRSEKIRTYNFNQDRITDHRINCNVYNVPQFFLAGHSLDIFVSKLQEEKKKEVLSQKLKEFSLSLQNNSA